MYLQLILTLILMFLFLGCSKASNKISTTASVTTTDNPTTPNNPTTPTLPSNPTAPTIPNAVPTPTPTPTPTEPIVEAIPITGSYCTLVDEPNYRMNRDRPFSIKCVQNDGAWKSVASFPEGVASDFTNPTLKIFWAFPAITKATNGDLLVSYRRELLPDGWGGQQWMEFVMKSYNDTTGWTQLGSTPININTASSTIISPYTQYGGNQFEIGGVPCYFWTKWDSSGATVSCLRSGVWVPTAVGSQTVGGFARHPEVLMSSTGTTAYLYYGEPAPKVFKFNGTTVTPVGTIPSATHSNPIYTTLVEWSGKLVLAVGTHPAPNYPNWSWYTAVSPTVIYSFNGTTWSTMTTQIEDTPGHDSVRSPLFTINGELYVMYADYTTSGIPTDLSKILFRFRVKKWDGTTWQRVGDESQPVKLSQRFEYFNDNGTILMNVVQPIENGTATKQVVLGWNPTDGFGQLGGEIKRDSAKYRSSRPGAVIKL